MQQSAPVPFRVGFVVSSASVVATLAASRLVERLLREPSLALDVAATGGAILLAVGIVYFVARLVLPPVAWMPKPLGPLTRRAQRELVAGVAALLVVGVVSRFWLNIEAMVPMGLFYVPMAFLWLRRDLARNQG